MFHLAPRAATSRRAGRRPDAAIDISLPQCRTIPTVVSYWNEVAVTDPDAHEYRVRIRPAGVHDLGAGSLGLAISLMEWLTHAIFHRRKWLIEVLDPQLPGRRNPVWAKGGYSSAEDCRRHVNTDPGGSKFTRR